MPRFAARLEYNGGGFVGWQRQKNGLSAQETVENALRRLEPNLAYVTAAGRTDTGVHALGQVIHFDLEKDWDPSRLCDALNAHLKPNLVSVLEAARVDGEFSARFSAIQRRYLYRIIIRRAPLALEKELAWRRVGQLDIGAMSAAAQMLIGRHDFTTFRSVRCQAASPIKTLDSIEIKDSHFLGRTEIDIRFRARSFLHRQVRSLVGTLERVGSGSMTTRSVRESLLARDRNRCGPVAPAHGLYLEHITYDPCPFACG